MKVTLNNDKTRAMFEIPSVSYVNDTEDGILVSTPNTLIGDDVSFDLLSQLAHDLEQYIAIPLDSLERDHLINELKETITHVYTKVSLIRAIVAR